MSKRTEGKMSGARLTIGMVHAMASGCWLLVVMTGHLTVLGFVWWTLFAAVVDQAAAWGIWALGDRGEIGPNRGWF